MILYIYMYIFFVQHASKNGHSLLVVVLRFQHLQASTLFFRARFGLLYLSLFLQSTSTAFTSSCTRPKCSKTLGAARTSGPLQWLKRSNIEMEHGKYMKVHHPIINTSENGCILILKYIYIYISYVYIYITSRSTCAPKYRYPNSAARFDSTRQCPEIFMPV